MNSDGEERGMGKRQRNRKRVREESRLIGKGERKLWSERKGLEEWKKVVGKTGIEAYQWRRIGSERGDPKRGERWVTGKG